MKLFGNKKNSANDDLPVATLVSEENTALYQQLPQASAPIEPAVVSAAAVTTEPTPCCQTNQHNNNGAFSSNDPTISRFPMAIRECPSCHREARTRVTTAPSWKTWTAGGVMMCVFWPLCWVPLVVDSCKETTHFCVSCGAKVAKVDAFQDCCVEHRG